MLASQSIPNQNPHGSNPPNRRRIGGQRASRGINDDDARMSDVSETRTDRKGRKVAYQKGAGKRGRVNLNGNADGDVNMRKMDKPYDASARHKRSSRNAPAPLAIKGAAKTSQEDRFSVIDVWRQVLTSRYNPISGMLNLENLAADPLLLEKKIDPPTVKSTRKLMAGALWKLVSEECPNIRTLSLASNQLANLGCLQPTTLVHYLGGKLTALSLAHNQIKEVKYLNPISQTFRPNSDLISGPRGLEVLKELLLMGNPIAQDNGPPGMEVPDWKAEVRKRFPTLESLDQQPLPSTSALLSVIHAPVAPVTNATGNSVQFPLGMQGGFMDAEAASLVTPFLTRFLPLFDSNRNDLIPVYAPHASFSYSVDTAKVPVGVKRSQLKTAPKGAISWDDFKHSSRNLARTGNHKAKISLATTREEIVKALNKFPKTGHDLSTPEAYCVDGWKVDTESGPRIMLMVHGEFTKHPTMFKTSFDRTFVLAPVDEGSPAQQAGWVCQILSDQLNLRGWISSDAWSPNSLPIQPAVPIQPLAIHNQSLQTTEPQPVTFPANTVASTPQEQQAMLSRFMQETRLLSEIAQQCLNANGWDYGRALTDLKNLQAAGQIPASAFQS
ncbi:NTF2-like protein [Atractiella rhizophila]|nr:NTF2-like protein [Atractiella rhizophila]